MKLISVPEAAARIGCSKSHIYTLVNKGQLRRFDIASLGSKKSKLRVADEDVDAYIASAEVPIPLAAS